MNSSFKQRSLAVHFFQKPTLSAPSACGGCERRSYQGTWSSMLCWSEHSWWKERRYHPCFLHQTDPCLRTCFISLPSVVLRPVNCVHTANTLAFLTLRLSHSLTMLSLSGSYNGLVSINELCFFFFFFAEFWCGGPDPRIGHRGVCFVP